MTQAEEGDAEAQNTVGEIFERGLGSEPNYEAAFEWYERAAEQGHAAAQLNLGMLYERGLGVERDRMRALNLYRQSWGLREDDLVYQSTVERELELLRTELTRQIAERDSQIRLLQRQIDQLQSRPQPSAEAQEELDDLRQWVARLQAERSQGQQELSSMREPQPLPDLNRILDDQVGREFGGQDFGRYFALVIGNQEYELMEDLASPVSDATKVSGILEDRYGFTVQLVTNANDLTVMQAMNNLRNVIGENDNLLIYYAGHGSRIQSEEIEFGYWLPTNAHRPPDDSLWIPTEQITKVMATTKAKRVLIVADSCYSGLLGVDFGTRASQASDPRIYQSTWFVENTFPKKSRLLISSGGDMPVLDNEGNGNSVFANAFIDVLGANEDLMTTHALFRSVRQRVVDSAEQQDIEQIPELHTITKAGHTAGEFFFVPNSG